LGRFHGAVCGRRAAAHFETMAKELVADPLRSIAPILMGEQG
jgi:hypothetical protein